MAEENKITLILEIKARGVTGVQTEYKKLEGTVGDVKDALKDMSKASSGFGNVTRQQIAGVTRNLEAAIARGEKFNQVMASGIGRKGASVSFGNSSTGSGLKAQRQQAKDFDAAIREDEKRTRQAERIQEQQARQQNKEERLNLRRAESLQKRNDIEKRNNLQNAASTAGFIGLGIARKASGVLDSAKITGAVSPTVSKVAGALGGLFGDTLGSIFANIGDALGKIFESTFDAIGGVLRIGIKTVGSFIEAVSVGIIGGISKMGIVVSIIGGILTAAVTLISTFITEVFSLAANLFKALGSLVTAGLQIIGAVFKGFASLVTGIWSGLWEGIKSVAQFSMDAVAKVTEGVLTQLAAGFADFVVSQQAASKAFNQIADTFTDGSIRDGIKLTEKSLDSLRQTFGQTLGDVSPALFEAASAGFRDIAQATEVAESAGKLATITQEAFGTTTKALTGVLNAYGMSAKDAEKITADLYGAFSVGSFSSGEFTGALSNVIGTAAALKVPIKDVADAMAFLSLNGIPAYKASVGLNRLFETIQTPLGKSAKEFKKLGINVDDVRASLKDGTSSLADFLKVVGEKLPENELAELFGTVQSRRAFLGITNEFGKFKKLTVDSGNAGKKFGEVFAESQKNIQVRMGKVSETFQVIRKNLAAGLFGNLAGFGLEKMQGALTGLSGALNSEKAIAFFKAFEDFARPVLDTILTPILQIINGITNAIQQGSADQFFKSKGVLQFRDLIIDIFNNILLIPKYVSMLTDGFAAAREVVSDLYNTYILPLMKVLGDEKVFDTMSKGLTEVREVAQEVYEIIMKSFTDKKTFKANFEDITNGLKEAFLSAGTFLFEVLSSVFSILGNLFAAVIGARLKSVFQQLIDEATGKLNQIIDGGPGYIDAVGEKGRENIIRKEQDQALDKAFEGFNNLVPDLKEAFENFKTSQVQNLINTRDNVRVNQSNATGIKTVERQAIRKMDIAPVNGMDTFNGPSILPPIMPAGQEVKQRNYRNIRGTKKVEFGSADTLDNFNSVKDAQAGLEDENKKREQDKKDSLLFEETKQIKNLMQRLVDLSSIPTNNSVPLTSGVGASNIRMADIGELG